MNINEKPSIGNIKITKNTNSITTKSYAIKYILLPAQYEIKILYHLL
jgi:hypothetical protein